MNNEFFKFEDSPDWGKRHKLGPVHFRLTCKKCGFIIDDFPTEGIEKAVEKMMSHCLEDLKKSYEEILVTIKKITSLVNVDGDGI